MLKRLALAAILVLFAAPLFAQAPTWVLNWDQPNASLTDAQGYVFQLKVDTAAPANIVATCTAGSPVKCIAQLPTLVTGPHTLTLSAANAFGTVNSAPLSGVPPSAPSNIVIVIKITVP